MEQTYRAHELRNRWVIKVLVHLMTVLTCVPGVAFGQWLRYPTADVPRTADGKPNLLAPAPRLPNGKPDFSGLWGTAAYASCTPNSAVFMECGTELPGSPLLVNVGRDLPGGLPYQAWAAALAKQRTADFSKEDPHVRCLPDNPPRPYALPHLTKALHTPRLLVLLYEVNAMYRQIFTDARPMPAESQPHLERLFNRRVGR